MKLWLLKPVKGLISPYNPWVPRYDKVHKIIVRAKTCSEARRIASECSLSEGISVWLNPKLTVCTALTDEGEVGLIIKEQVDG